MMMGDVLNVDTGKSKGSKKRYEDGEPEISRWWIKLRFLRSCISSKTKVDGSDSGSSTHDAEETKPSNVSIVDQPIAHAISSPSMSNTGSIPSTPNIVEELKISLQLQRFTFDELRIATKNFRPENLLGEGGFGRVFKGWINENGRALTVAVKTLNKDGLQGHKEWLAEVNFLGDLRHPNLVKLFGYCIEDDHRLLVYEFMPRGNLENHLFRRTLPLPWFLRMKIALSAAKGLAFLHEEAERPVIFRDFKSSNILLDADYNAKLSDFGLAKDAPEGDKTHVSTRVMGTYGYVAPEYVMTGHLTSKSDVYTFGVVLLEILTGRKSMDKSRPIGEHNLVDWAKPYLRERRRFYHIIDPRLEGRFSIKGMLKTCQLAADCLRRDPKARPRMSEVVEVLKPLPDLMDMACNSPYFQAILAERTGTNRLARNVNSVQGGSIHGNGELTRSPTILYGAQASPLRFTPPKRRAKTPEH